MFKKYITILIIIMIFLVGGVIGFFTNVWIVNQKLATRTSIIRNHDPRFQLISPLLAVGDSEQARSYPQWEAAIAQEVDAAKKQGIISDASVYFRDLENSRWFGVNENQQYAPASLLKIVYLIAYARALEENPQLADIKISYSNPVNRSDPAEPNAPALELGHAYSISDLLQRMITYSDNDAANMLAATMPKEIVSQVFTDLHIQQPDRDDAGNSISAKQYSLFFRILYNSSYVSRQISEGALSLLTQVSFKNGLVAGLPDNIMIAHKYGHRVLENEKNNKEELHDCGIIYYPERPYLLCVMTRGDNFQALEQFIAGISRHVYEQVSTASKP